MGQWVNTCCESMRSALGPLPYSPKNPHKMCMQSYESVIPALGVGDKWI